MATTLTPAALSKLSKEELINLVLENSNVKDQLKEITTTLNTLTDKMAAMEETNNLLKAENELLGKRLRDTESALTTTAQYTRRHSLELSTSAAPLYDGAELKTNVAKLLSTSGVAVTAHDIDVAHMLGKEKKRVIITMISRDKRYDVLRARKNLKDKKDATYGSVYINESLCPQFQRLDYLLRRMKKGGHIHSSWFWNGRLSFKKTEQSEKITISHELDIMEKFTGNAAVHTIIFG